MNDTPPLQIRMPPAGFAAVLHIECISVDAHEHRRLLTALQKAGYRIRQSLEPSDPDADGVFGGRWILTRDAPVQSVVLQAPQPPAPPAPPAESQADTGPSEVATEPVADLAVEPKA